MQIHQYSRTDYHHARKDQQPANDRLSIKKYQSNANIQRDERQPKGVVAAPIPESARDDNTADQHIAARDRHRKADQKLDKPARCTANIL